MPDVYISITIQREVIRLSNGCCEYCLHPESYSTDYYHFDHIISLFEGGKNELGNIARSCGRCNILKSQITHAFDPVTGRIFPLYNPRKDVWTEHFGWSDDELLVYGLTEIGRTTIEVLQLNRESAVNLRRLLKMVKLHPPKFSILT
jgi:HNH endonuclease